MNTSRWNVASVISGAVVWAAVAVLVFSQGFVLLRARAIGKSHRTLKVQRPAGEICLGTAYFSDARRAS